MSHINEEAETNKEAVCSLTSEERWRIRKRELILWFDKKKKEKEKKNYDFQAFWRNIYISDYVSPILTVKYSNFFHCQRPLNYKKEFNFFFLKM